MDDTALYGRMLDSMEAFFGFVGEQGPQGATIRRHGLLATLCPAIPHRSVFNSVVYRDAEVLEGALDELAGAYDDAGVLAWTVWTPEGDALARSALERAGHLLDAHPRAMAAPLQEINLAPGADATDWERVAEAGEMCSVLERAFGWEMDATRHVFARLPELGHVYVAREAGRAVACAAALDAQGDCAIWNVGTLSEARGRGLATALMCQALSDARARGCITTSLQATAMGRPVYARLGYRDLGEIGMWERRRQGSGTT